MVRNSQNKPRAYGCWLAVMLLAALALSGGCRRSRTYSVPGGGTTTVSQKGDNVDVTFKGKDGEEVQVSGGGSGVALPKEFPQDVAIYPKATVFASTKDKKGAMSVILKIAGSAAQVATFYEEQLKKGGWEIENTMNMGDITMLQCAKEGRKLAVSVNKGPQETMVTLVLEKGE